MVYDSRKTKVEDKRMRLMIQCVQSGLLLRIQHNGKISLLPVLIKPEDSILVFVMIN